MQTPSTPQRVPCPGTGRRVYSQPKGSFRQSHICEVCGQSVYTVHDPRGFLHAYHEVDA